MLVLFDCYTIVIFLLLFLWYLNCTLGIEKECDFLLAGSFLVLCCFLNYVLCKLVSGDKGADIIRSAFLLLPFILAWRTFVFMLNCFYFIFFIKNELKNKQTNKH